MGIISLLLLATIACSPSTPKEPVARKAELAAPERTIEQPPKAERITEEEYIQAAKTAGNIGLVDNPMLNFPLDTDCAYVFEDSSGAAGASRFTFVKGGDGFSVDGAVDLALGDGDERGFSAKFTCTFDGKLRPRVCNIEMPDAFSGTTVKKRIDFNAEKFGVEYLNQPDKKEPTFRAVERPAGDVWPFIPNANIDMAIIGACTGPGAENAEIWMLNLVQDTIERFSLKFIGEKDIQLQNPPATVRAKEYKGYLNENLYGEYYFTPDGRLVMADESGGLHAELSIAPARKEAAG